MELTDTPQSDKAEKARKAYVDQTDHVNRIYGRAGVTVLEPEVWNFLLSLSSAYYKAGARRPAGDPHPWLVAGPQRMDYLMHELGRTHDWLQREKRKSEELRREWLKAKIAAGQFVSPQSKMSAGIEE